MTTHHYLAVRLKLKYSFISIPPLSLHGLLYAELYPYPEDVGNLFFLKDGTRVPNCTTLTDVRTLKHNFVLVVLIRCTLCVQTDGLDIPKNSITTRHCPSVNIMCSVDKKNQLDVTFCVLYFSSNSCSTCFGQPCAHHQELTTA